MKQTLPLLVIIGHVAYDQNTYSSGEKSPFFPSGDAYFGAVGASLYNKHVGIVSRVGSDYDMHLLTRLSIDIEGVRKIPHGKTTRFYLGYTTPDSRERTFRSEFNVNTDLSPLDIPPRYLMASHIHIACMPPQKQQLFITFLKQKSNAKLSLDTIEQFIERWPHLVANVMQQVDMVFIDSNELAMIKKHGLHTMKANAELVLKEGAKGASYIYGKKRITVSAPLVQTIVDKSGAGDVLAGVFLALLVRGEAKQFALQTAVKVASESLKGYGVEALL